MPCASSFDPPSDGADYMARRELDTVTRMLCALLRGMESRGELPDDPELRKWYAEHREHDRKVGRP